MSPEPYLTVGEALVYLQLGSTSAIYRAIRDHGLPFGRIGRRYRFRKAELDAWVVRNRQEVRVGPVAVSAVAR